MAMSPHAQPQASPPASIRRTKSESTISSISSLFPLQRTSFIAGPSPSSRKKVIVSIAIRKGLFVFCSVHGVVSSALIALAFVKGKGRAKGSHVPSKTFKSVLLDIIRSSNTVRLAAWLGLYSYLWTVSSAFLRRQPHWLPEWHPFIAGALSGLSLFAQTKEDRREIAPNVFCRGLYSLLLHHPLFKFRHGDICLFALANAQIAIGFLLHPSTLPAWYVSWIGRVGYMNPRFVQLNRHILQKRVPTRADLQSIYHRLLHRDAQPRTWSNELKLQAWLADPQRLHRSSAPCSLNHPGFSSCLGYNLNQVLRTIISMSPTYAILHLVPSLIFRSKVLLKAPLQFFFTLFKKTFFSALFLATFASVVQNCFCLPTKVYDRFRLRLAGKRLYALLGAMTGLSLLWEEPKRRGELALYCAPKGLYSMWAVLKSAGLVRSLPFGDIIVGCVGSGMLMHCFVHGPEKMPGLAKGLISQVVDPHTPDRQKKERPGQAERQKQEPVQK